MELALIGRGIAASPSPAMHEAALRACGLDGHYRLLDVAPEELDAVVDGLRGGLGGANVTMPYKRDVALETVAAGGDGLETVAARCDGLEGDAVLLGAVNTVVVEEGRLVGANTDAAGLLAALAEAPPWTSLPTSAVVLGGGGAAAAAVLALQRAGVAGVGVAARRGPAARDVASRTGAAWVAWEAAAVLGALGEHGVVVDATPAPPADLPLDFERLPPGTSLVGLAYRPRPLPLVVLARAHGLGAVDGRAMLLHQAAAAFSRWTGMAAPLEVMRIALLARLAG